MTHKKTIFPPKRIVVQVLSCHRLLLAASSPLLSSCLAATQSWPEDRSCVVLPDFTAQEVTTDVVYIQLLTFLSSRLPTSLTSST